jgi:hypothetical protein
MRLKSIFLTLFVLAAWPGLQPAYATGPVAAAQKRNAQPASLKI